MKLNYLVQPIDLGGTAVVDCGTIHQSEITETLKQLSLDLKLSFDLNEYTIGSTGKREYSGDIDLVLDEKLWTHGIGPFRELLEHTFGKSNVERNGDMLHLRYPIVGFAADFDEYKPRNGFVQVDFNIADAEWERFYHYSHSLSAYKGAHRNLMIAAICSATQLENVKPGTVDGFDRPVESRRWKWGSNGLIRVNRKSVKDKTGNWMRKQLDTVMNGPYVDPAIVSRALLPIDGTPRDLYSVETLMSAIKCNYGMVDQERIWRRSAGNFSDWNQGKLFKYPPEIEQYLLSNDK